MNLLHYALAFCSCATIAVLYNLHRSFILAAAFGGVFGRIVYDLVGLSVGDPIVQLFITTIAIALYAEFFARVLHAPVIVFLVVSIFPLVPGSGLYYTMSYFIEHDMVAFAEAGGDTMLRAGTMALAVVLVSSLVRLVKIKRFPVLLHHQAKKYYPKMK